MTINELTDRGYAQFETFDQISYKCIKYLMENDETIWRLLYYNTPNAWDDTNPSLPNLTLLQKASLIYDGSDDTSKFRVFMDQGQPDTITEEVCTIRILPYRLGAPNKVVGDMQVLMECYPHFKINHLSNYRTRTDMIMKRFVQVFNGKIIPGVGLGALFLDDMGTYGTRLEMGGQTPFRGKWLILGTHSV